MPGQRLRWLTAGLFASAGVFALTSMMNAAFAFGDDATGLVMGGSGTPIPGTDYVGAANNLYTENPLNFGNPYGTATLPYTTTDYPGPLQFGVSTPEGLYPLEGVKELPFNYPLGAEGYTDGQQTSVAQGVDILNNYITSTDGPITVFGYSQSATIASYEMAQLKTSDPSAPVQFVLIGDVSNPDGGLLARFPDLTLPSLGLQFGNSTPADDFPTVIYSQEYDGFADFPKYPINFLSDLNALLGVNYLHYNYLGAIPADGLTGPAPDVGSAVPVATSGTTDTAYYMIPTADLPLLDPLRDLPVLGNPIADLLQPDLALLVNLGYDNPNPLEGWDVGQANVQTAFGLFPPVSQVVSALEAVPSQTSLGIENFIGDLTGTGPNPMSLASLASLPDLSSGTTSALSDPLAAFSTLSSDPGAAITDIANTISGDASTAYATLLPTADIANALLTSIPAYDVSLALDSLQAGDLVDAVGLPIAADTGLATLAGGFEFTVVSSAAQTIADGLTALIP